MSFKNGFFAFRSFLERWDCILGSSVCSYKRMIVLQEQRPSLGGGLKSQPHPHSISELRFRVFRDVLEAQAPDRCVNSETETEREMNRRKQGYNALILDQG